MKKSLSNIVFLPGKISVAEKKRIFKEADSSLDHEFFSLGKKIKFAGKINWHSNFSNKSWPLEPYQDFRANNYDFDSKNYIGDIKLTWELNKLLHLQDLAKAYLVSKDEKYTQEFVDEISDWLENNPFEVGVNWTEGLIASHRVISWIIALSGFIGSDKIDNEFIKKITQSIYQHALFIEKTYEFCGRASNHLLGELCVQIVISAIFPEFEGSKKRLKDAIDNLEKELDLQVYKDGVDYEKSVSYQRVILEFLYLPLILQKRGLLKLPSEIGRIAEKMTEFMMHMTQPNGLLQPISDADGARVFILGNDINDFRPHLALAAWLFGRSDFKYVSEDKIDQVCWFFSPRELRDYNNMRSAVPQETSVAFRQGGYWVSRQDWSKSAAWLFFDCGYMGMGEWPSDLAVGVHGHSDILNFGLAIEGQTYLTDNGSYAYTTERPYHQYFRSSIAHNIFTVDDQDQNIIDPRPWLTYQKTLPQNPRSYLSEEIDYFSGEHTGYLRLSDPVLSKRELMFFKKENFLILKDSFSGKGSHRITERFHLMPDLTARSLDGEVVIGEAKNKLSIKPLFSASQKIVVGQKNPVLGWYAPNYGLKVKSPTLNFSFSTNLGREFYFLFSWSKNPVEHEGLIERFNTELARIKKPKLLMMATSDLGRDSRVQREAFSASKGGFDVSVLTYVFSIEKEFTAQEFQVKQIIHQSLDLRVKISNWLGKKIIFLSSKIQILVAIIPSAFRSRLRNRTYKLIDNDINQPTEAAPKKGKPSVRPGILARIIYAIYYYRRLNKTLILEGLKLQPDIIHANDLDTLYAGYVIKKKTGAKLVYDSHEIWTKQGLEMSKLLVFGFSILERFLLRKIDALISVNESLIGELAKMYHFRFAIPTQAVMNCPNRQALPKAKEAGKKITILYQGGCLPGRGLEQLAQSGKFLSPKAKIVIRAVGNPTIIEAVKKIRDKNHLAGKIEIAAPVRPEELVRSAKEADIGVIANLPTSINNILVLPNKMFEYMQAGLAIACSDLPEMKKIINQYNNGVTFNPNNPKSIARALNNLISDPHKLLEMKKGSLAAAKVFCWENEEKKLINVYHKVLND